MKFSPISADNSIADAEGMFKGYPVIWLSGTRRSGDREIRDKMSLIIGYPDFPVPDRRIFG